MRLAAVAINGILDLKNFYPLALELKTKHSINVDILGYRPDIANLTKLYDGLIVGSDWNQNAALVQAFNAAGRKTILLQSEGMFFQESQWYVGKAPIAKAACLWGPIHKDIFLRRGYTGALAVAGPPRFDIYWKFPPAMSKRMVYKKLGLPDLDRPYVVYLCQFFPRHEFGDALFQNQIDLTRSAAGIADIGYAVIKTHPQESKDYFSRSEVLGGSLPDHVRILDTGGHTEAIEISTLMYHAAGVVTFSSTAAIEAMMMGRRPPSSRTGWSRRWRTARSRAFRPIRQPTNSPASSRRASPRTATRASPPASCQATSTASTPPRRPTSSPGW